MTHSSEPRPVVVGVDGSDASRRAVRYAAHEAVALDAALTVVHVTPGVTPAGPMLPIAPDPALRTWGFKVLADAATWAREECPDLEVDTHLVTAGRVSGLVDAAEHAPLLVLGNERRSLAEHVWTGATVAGAAARADCPVVVVPPDWDGPTTHGRVVVGVKSPRHAPELLAAGFALADVRGAELVVLHAWKLMSGYDDVVSDRTSVAEFGRQELAVLEPLLTDLEAAYPEVRVRAEVVHDQAAHALVHASATADRLLLQRPAHGGFLHHLGSVARAVLRESHCPVEVLAPARASGAPWSLDLEAHGALRR